MEHLVGSTITVPSGKLPVVVVHYELENHPVRTEHWSLAVLLNPKEAEVHEILGNYDSFAYVPKFREPFWSSKLCRGGVVIGFIEPHQVSPLGGNRNSGDDLANSTLVQWLRSVEIVKGTADFDCQTWIIQALVILRENGITLPGVDEKHIRRELELEKERENYGLDLVNERLAFH